MHKVAEVMGLKAGDNEPMIAVVRCNGGECNSPRKADYDGLADCASANMNFAGKGGCAYGCLGFGSCARVCPEGAIRIIDKKAVVDENLCIACGKCVKICPHQLIELVPAESHYRVQCFSHVKGKDVRDACTAGCIACGICQKVCEAGAITVVDNIAKIDYEKCTSCGKCAEKCPRKIIKKY